MEFDSSIKLSTKRDFYVHIYCSKLKLIASFSCEATNDVKFYKKNVSSSFLAI